MSLSQITEMVPSQLNKGSLRSLYFNKWIFHRTGKEDSLQPTRAYSTIVVLTVPKIVRCASLHARSGRPHKEREMDRLKTYRTWRARKRHLRYFHTLCVEADMQTERFYWLTNSLRFVESARAEGRRCYFYMKRHR